MNRCIRIVQILLYYFNLIGLGALLLAATLAVVIPVAFINPRIFSAANITAVSMDASDSLLHIHRVPRQIDVDQRSECLNVQAQIGRAHV
mgnify:CR=1 FL=1